MCVLFGITEFLGFVLHVIFLKKIRFGDWICFLPQIRRFGAINSVGSQIWAHCRCLFIPPPEDGNIQLEKTFFRIYTMNKGARR
jgi:hypothetical protein